MGFNSGFKGFKELISLMCWISQQHSKSILLCVLYVYRCKTNSVTLIRLVRLLDVADWNWMLLFDSAGAAAKLRAVVRFTGPLLLCEGSSVPLPGSCFIGISDMDGVMVVATSNSDMVRTEPFPPLLAPPTVWLLEGAFEFESTECGEPGHSPFTRCDDGSELNWELPPRGGSH